MPAGEPVVLLHGLGMSERVWDDVRPVLARHHDVVALTALGHRGGAAAARRPVTVADLVDHAERALDERGLARPHLAGNSLGGWMAIELARRGRARTVCAISPAGFWAAGTPEQHDGTRILRAVRLRTRLSRPLPLPLVLRAPLARRVALRDIAAHGERRTPAQVIEAADDLLGCTIFDDLLTTGEEIAPLHPLPCPVTLAWAAQDAIVPLAVNGAVGWARLPEARFTVLPGAGHVAMADDPEAVARTILLTAARG
jgi:pimeloyl-ACP methyl ester carboxylesterase